MKTYLGHNIGVVLDGNEDVISLNLLRQIILNGRGPRQATEDVRENRVQRRACRRDDHRVCNHR